MERKPVAPTATHKTHIRPVIRHFFTVHFDFFKYSRFSLCFFFSVSKSNSLLLSGYAPTSSGKSLTTSKITTPRTSAMIPTILKYISGCPVPANIPQKLAVVAAESGNPAVAIPSAAPLLVGNQ